MDTKMEPESLVDWFLGGVIYLIFGWLFFYVLMALFSVIGRIQTYGDEHTQQFYSYARQYPSVRHTVHKLEREADQGSVEPALLNYAKRRHLVNGHGSVSEEYELQALIAFIEGDVKLAEINLNSARTHKEFKGFLSKLGRSWESTQK
jgi:hypothetical protein